MTAGPARTRLKHVLQGVLLAIIFFSILSGSLVLWWALRPNQSQVNPDLKYDQWDAVTNGRHNANTDLIFWNGYYYFIYANQPGNQGSTTTFLELDRSTDFHTWSEVARFNVPNEDIRDPKMCIIHDQLFIYYLKNAGFIADPYTTAFVNSSDGVHFSEPQDVFGQEGWLFWRPKTNDGVTWYVTGYWHEKGQCTLLSSTNGFNWTMVSSVVNASGLDESELVFLPDSRMLVTCRVEIEIDSVLGDVNAGTAISVAAPPYTEWNRTFDKTTRLDGPNLFSLYDASTGLTRLFALGRFQPDRDSLFTASGSVFSRKYTSLYEFTNLSGTPKLTYISDLPSDGDTAYLGVIVQGDCLYASYYSNDLTRDYAWWLGMLLPSDIYMVNISVASIFNAAAHPLPIVNVLPWDNYLIVGANASFIVATITWIVRKRSKKESENPAGKS